MKINLESRRSEILTGVAMLFLLFVFSNVAVSTVQAQEAERDCVILWSYRAGGAVNAVFVFSKNSEVKVCAEKR